MAKLWHQGGKIVGDLSAGKVTECDDCPCVEATGCDAVCDPQPSRFEAEVFGVINGHCPTCVTYFNGVVYELPPLTEADGFCESLFRLVDPDPCMFIVSIGFLLARVNAATIDLNAVVTAQHRFSTTRFRFQYPNYPLASDECVLLDDTFLETAREEPFNNATCRAAIPFPSVELRLQAFA